MNSPYNVAVFVGSLRKESLNLKVAKALIALAPESLKLTIVPIGELPLYSEDLEAELPASVSTFRDAVRGVDALLFVTPEYNRSLPGVLKNAIDVGSRPYGKSIWDKKPGAVVSASPSPMGGFGANHHLRQCMVFLNVPVMQQPEAYIGGVNKLLDADAGFVPATRTFFEQYLQAFSAWIDRTAVR